MVAKRKEGFSSSFSTSRKKYSLGIRPKMEDGKGSERAGDAR